MRVSGCMSRQPAMVAPGDSLTERVLATGDVADLQVSVTEVCGAVEVRVWGPGCDLWRRFDRADLQPAYVRHVMRRLVKRYRTSLGYRRPEAGYLGRERA